MSMMDQHLPAPIASAAGTLPARALPSGAALAETTGTYDADSGDFAALQWEADFTRYVDAFVRLVPNADFPLLDAGCGSGRDVAALASRGFRCIGVDLSGQMLAEARRRVTDPSATWLQCDIRSIPLGPLSVAGIWTNAALLHLDGAGQADAVQEFRRLLRPGRPLFISTLAGDGWSSRLTAGGHRRWFWGTNRHDLVRIAESCGFAIVSASTEPGIVARRWVNILALAR